MTIAGGEVINCHVKLANVYKEMLNGSQTSGHIYGLELGPRIAGMCYIDATRISDVDVLEHPETGATLTLYRHTKTAERAIQQTVIGTMAVDGWAVTFGTARRGLGGPPPGSSSQ